MESIAPPTQCKLDDVLVIDGGAIVTANAYVAYSYNVFSLASLLFSALKESMSSQDLRPTRPTPLIRQKQRKRNFMLLVQRRVPERNLNVQSRVKIHVRIITISYKNYNLIAISSKT